MKNFLFILGALFSIHPLQVNADMLLPATSPENISSDIDKYGAKTVVQYLLESNEYDAVMDHISAGKKDWIDLIPKLQPGTDAASAESIPIALADALPRNPKDVLAVFNSHRELDFVCSGPFIEPEKAFLKSYKKKAVAAVEKIQVGGSDRAKRCLRDLKEINTNYTPLQ